VGLGDSLLIWAGVVAGCVFVEAPAWPELACAAAKGASSNEMNSEAMVFMSDHWDRGFAGGIEEGERDDFGGDGFAFGLDSHFDVESGAEGGVVAPDAGQGNHFLQCW